MRQKTETSLFSISDNKKRFLNELASSNVNLSNPDRSTVLSIAEYYKEKFNIEIYVSEQEVSDNNNIELEKKIRDEILQIQKELRDDQVRGYMCGINHFDAAIISKYKIIIPVTFFLKNFSDYIHRSINESYLPYLYDSNYSPKDPICPQAGTYRCAHVRLIFLKELLKEEAKQLKEFTLSFEYINNNEKKFFFLPSPQVLRYSESSKLIRYYIDLLSQGRINQLFEEQSLNWKVENHELIANLPDFSRKWLNAYLLPEEKRKAMYHTNNKGFTFNQYLFYSSIRLNAKVEERKKLQNHKESISLQELMGPRPAQQPSECIIC